MEKIAAVADPIFAMTHMKDRWPATLVIICSTLTEAGAPSTLEALATGVVTTIPEPKLGLKTSLHDHALELTAAIRMAMA